VKEIALANTTHHPDDPADEPGLHLLHAMSFSKAQPLDETVTLLWSAEESDNLIDLMKDDDGMPEVKEEF
jgi:hypothetical protein